jgi:hypothetical protein
MNKLDIVFSFISKKSFQDRLRKINIFIALISILLVIRMFTNESLDIREINNLNILEIIYLAIIYLNNAYIWSKFSNQNVSNVNFKVFADWAYSNIGKYIPGGIGLALIRLNQDGDENKSKKIIFGLLEEQFLYPLLSIPVLILCKFLIKIENFIFVYIFVQIVFFYLFRYFYLLNKTIKYNSMINFSKPILFSLLSSNLIVFFIFYNQGIDDYLLKAIFYLIASNVGLFFVGVPAGIGIRELIFIFLVGTSTPFAELAIVLIYIRLLFLIVDTIFGLIGFLIKLKNQ